MQNPTPVKYYQMVLILKCSLRMIRMRVFGLHAGHHLLLIRTKLGYRTILTAACARQGCSASGLVWFFEVYYKKVRR
jgi:hypothetical protein